MNIIQVPSNWILVTWCELKIRNGKIDYIGKSECYDEIVVFKNDSWVTYYTKFLKEFSNEEGNDCKDFYDNYKGSIDVISTEINTTSLPFHCLTYFAGAGDTSTYAPSSIGAGEGIFVSLSTFDESKSKTIQFNDDFFLVDGYFCGKNAPFGASLDVEILDYNDNVVACFAKKVPIFNTMIHFENTNRGFVSKYYKIKTTVYNTEPGIFNEHDAACSFKVFGCFKVYRRNIYEN